jgi:glycyl-tRNA synthetase
MAEPKETPLMEKIVSLCKRRGFIFQSSEIYGGINGFWDYGPLGAELKRNVKELWWRSMTRQREDVVGLEASIIMHPRIWEASGHTSTFSDPMVDCLGCRKRFRADQVEPRTGMAFAYQGASDPTSGKSSKERFAALVPAGKPPESAHKLARQFYQARGIESPVLAESGPPEKVENSTRYCNECGALLTEPRQFNLMFKTYVGPVESEENTAYLRPETAQAIFAQFKNVLEVSRQKIPFGIAQVGKAFRNEINPRNYTFRSREFEQMELEFFIRPDEAVEAVSGRVASAAEISKGNNQQPIARMPDAGPQTPDPISSWGWEAWHKYWVEERVRWYESIGLPRSTLVEYWQKPEELAHYARATVDLLFKFPFGTQELEGIAARSDFDLSQHQRFSGKAMSVFDDELKVAWAKLDEAKKKELWQRYHDARTGSLSRTGVAPEAAAKQAREEADALTRGNYIPHVIEPSAGVDRLILALVCHAYSEDEAPDEKGKLETRVVMRFHPRVAPIKVAVFPLLKNRPELVHKAKEVRDLLRPHMTVFYDEAGAIGRRYRRQDEAGTPFGVTVDFDTLGEKGPELKDTVTLRDRDSMGQERVSIAALLPLLLEKLR